MAGHLWSGAGTGLQHRIFLDSGPFVSERVPVLRFRSCLVLWFREGRNFGSRSCLRSKLSPLCILWLHDLQFCSVVSKEQLRIGLVWASSVVILLVHIKIEIHENNNYSFTNSYYLLSLLWVNILTRDLVRSFH